MPLLPFTVRLDPGGWLPDWVVRVFVRDAPAVTLRAFKAQVLKTRGQYEDFLAPYRARRAPAGTASNLALPVTFMRCGFAPNPR